MRIGLLGTRGIPASYSGFETCVEQLGQRLVERGHTVTAYCRSHHITYSDPSYKGIRLVKLPTIASKYLDTIVHTTLSSLHALTQGYDVALYFISGNSVVSWVPRLVGTRTVLNVDGLDWKREKWPEWAKRYIQFAEYLATKFPSAFVTDSHVVQAYYRDRFGAEPPYIPYGSEIEVLPPGPMLKQFGLQPNRYVLYVGRLVPENCAHDLVDAFRDLDTDFRCVVVGDAPYADRYIHELKARAEGDPRIIFTGYQFGKAYQELGANSYLFVETSGVGGTHPALLEAMALGNCVVVNDTRENLETIGGAGVSYGGEQGADGLRHVLRQLLAQPDTVASYRARARELVRTRYSWEAVTDSYEELFYKLCRKSLPQRLHKGPAQAVPPTPT